MDNSQARHMPWALTHTNKQEESSLESSKTAEEYSSSLNFSSTLVPKPPVTLSLSPIACGHACTHFPSSSPHRPAQGFSFPLGISSPFNSKQKKIFLVFLFCSSPLLKASSRFLLLKIEVFYSFLGGGRPSCEMALGQLLFSLTWRGWETTPMLQLRAQRAPFLSTMRTISLLKGGGVSDFVTPPSSSSSSSRSPPGLLDLHHHHSHLQQLTTLP